MSGGKFKREKNAWFYCYGSARSCVQRQQSEAEAEAVERKRGTRDEPQGETGQEGEGTKGCLMQREGGGPETGFQQVAAIQIKSFLLLLKHLMSKLMNSDMILRKLKQMTNNAFKRVPWPVF